MEIIWTRLDVKIAELSGTKDAISERKRA